MPFRLSSPGADDIFISYSRRDANTYAVGLADALTRCGFSCFFDRLGTEANTDLPPSLIATIRSCTMLVVVGSPAARESAFVAREIREFTAAHGSARAVPIHFGAPAIDAVWHQQMVGIAPEVESSDALIDGTPSPAVVNRIEKSFNYVRSKDRLRRYTLGAAVVLALLVVVSIGAAMIARDQLAQARDAKAAADASKADADAQKGLASAAADNARDAAARADVARTAAMEQQRLAEQAGLRAAEERVKADREASNARASGLVSVARRLTDGDPLTASLLLLEARSPSDPAEGAAVARELVNRFVPKVTLRGHQPAGASIVGITDVAFNSKGTMLVTAGSDGTARLWPNDRSGRSTVLRGHTRTVSSVRFSPDNERVLTAGADDTARIWNVDGTGTPVVLRHPGGGLQKAQFSPDGRLVLTFGGDTAAVQNADGSGSPIVLAHEAYIACAAFSPDGRYVFTGSGDGMGRIWNVDGSGQPIVLAGGGGTVQAAAFSPDGRRVAIGSLSGGGRVWLAAGTGAPVLLGNGRAQVQVVTFSPDGTKVALMPFGESVEIWNTDGSGTPVRLAPPTNGGPAHTITFSADGRLVLLSWHNGVAEIRNTDGTGVPVTLRGHSESLSAAAFSPDMRELVTASYDATARIWTRSASDDPGVLRGIVSGDAHYSPDGRHVVAPGPRPSPGMDHPVLLWDVARPDMPRLLHGHTQWIATTSFSPDGTKVLSGSFDGTARIWPVGGDAPVVLGLHDGPVRRTAFSPDGTRVMTVVDQVRRGEYVYPAEGVVRVWRADGTGSPVVLRGHKGDIGSAAFSPDGRRIVTGGGDASIRVWAADGSRPPVTLHGHKSKVTATRFDPSGRRVASVSEDRSAMVQLADGSGVPVRWGADAPLQSIEFSPDGNRVLIMAANEPVVYIWTPGSTAGVYILRGHTSWVNSARFSSDGRQVVTASNDGTFRVWRADGTGEPLVLAGDARIPAEWAEFSPDRRHVLTVGAVARVAAGQAGPRVWTVSWSGLLDQLQERTRECLSVSQRLQYLDEQAAEAAARAAACERGAGSATR